MELTDRADMTLDIDRAVKRQNRQITQQNNTHQMAHTPSDVYCFVMSKQYTLNGVCDFKGSSQSKVGGVP